MAAVGNPATSNMATAGAGPGQRTKSSVFKSFIHRRNNSDGSALPSAQLTPTTISNHDQNLSQGNHDVVVGAGLSGFPWQGNALGELQQNRQDQLCRSPKKPKDGRQGGASSPKKNPFITISQKSQGISKLSKAKEVSPSKPKKAKSVTNLATLLSRPKSSKNLRRLASDEEDQKAKDKENRSPPNSLGSDNASHPPIYAQFCTEVLAGQISASTSPFDQLNDPFGHPPSGSTNITDGHLEAGVFLKPRPKSFQPPSTFRYQAPESSESSTRDAKKSNKDGSASQRSSTWGKKEKTTRPKILTVFSGEQKSSKTSVKEASEPQIDAKDIDTHLEAMLNRRNIPENQRYKMRNLASTIKMEFIRQDWAETQAKELGRPASHNSDVSADGIAGGSDQDMPKTKTSRVKSLTLSKGASKNSSSPTKKRPEGTLGRHFRSKSTESVTSDRPSSTASSSTNSLLSKIKLNQSPSDFVAYLRKVQKPELVEVGKLHKLRLLLRNETVAWTEDFIRQGGMKEIVGLLNRIMEVEWREEHEDALLHENLLCLKALCTTALALQYLHSIHTSLFPALIHMIFDPEKKGPSEFTTRGIITSVLFTYIQSAAPEEKIGRAQTILEYLRDPEGNADERPVSFVLEMRRDRPYRVWCKEAVNVTKEVFWIFLHNLNVVALPLDKATRGGQPIITPASSTGQVSNLTGGLSYMIRHFPQERSPVAAAPYVGGVEWDATNYLASHLDLMNAIIACTPGAVERNQLREQLRISGWERCLGGSLRLCKEKFYGAVHEGLRTWVAAAHEDGWNVKDVRYGPPADVRGSPRKAAGGNGGRKKAEEPAPKIEIPKLDFGLDAPL